MIVRVLKRIGLIGAAVAVIPGTLTAVALFRDGPRFVVTVVALLLLLAVAGVAACASLTLRSVNVLGLPFALPVRRASRTAPLVIMIVAVMGIALVFVMPGLRAPLEPERPRVAQVVVGSDEDSYVLEVTVSNPSDRALLVTRLEVLASEDNGLACCCPPVEQYTISRDVTLVASPGGGPADDRAQLRFEVASASNDALKGVTWPAMGSVYAFCSQYHLSLALDTAVEVPARGHSSIVLRIPAEFDVADDQTGAASLGAAAGPGEARTLAPRVQSTRVHFPEVSAGGIAEIVLVMHTSDGERIERAVRYPPDSLPAAAPDGRRSPDGSR